MSAALTGAAAILRVEDTGSGISPEHLPHVFDRFFRGDRDRPRDRGGAGLGLSICRSIARAHGGEIWLESEVGKGTVANVQLPAVGSTAVLPHGPTGHAESAYVAD